MEIQILNMIQTWHSTLMDTLMVFISTIGNSGMIWIAIGLLLLISKKYRRGGIAVLLALLLGYIGGNLIIKHLFMRQRPCWIYPDIVLLIPNPTDYSFPSGHTQAAFAAAVSLYYMNKKAGVAAVLLAFVMGFSRMYLYVHFPTDVLAGMLLGIFWALLAQFLLNRMEKRKHERSN